MTEGTGAPSPGNYFLNERHELVRDEKDSGGRVKKYAGLDWALKASTISQSIASARDVVQSSQDPIRDRRLFLVALPERELKKPSADARIAPDGFAVERPDFGGAHAGVFRRLGMDLLSVTSDGRALVHARADQVDQLIHTSEQLHVAGPAERARWAPIHEFKSAPSEIRLAPRWLDSLSHEGVHDTIVELQPVLSPNETNEVLRAIRGMLTRDTGEDFAASGRDFSGRSWVRARLRRNTLVGISQRFFSIQSLHSPYYSVAATSSPHGTAGSARGTTSPPTDVSALPTVAVVETGIPANHPQLASYCRGRMFLPGVVRRYHGSHGSIVASRVVFGDLDFRGGIEDAGPGDVAFVDMVVSDSEEIDYKTVTPAIDLVIANHPFVRTINLSINDREPLISLDEVDRGEHLIAVRDLDNLIFARDVLVVVAAGNSPRGKVPLSPYPDHADESAWGLSMWANSYNALVCGSYARWPAVGGVARLPYSPSGFTRCGPGLAGAPIPTFGANGGDCLRTYAFEPGRGLGVWGANAAGMWEDQCGTSHAAPLLAREVAKAFAALERVCGEGGRPFGVTVKSFLALTADAVAMPAKLRQFAARTVGLGTASATALYSAPADRARFVWQGVLAGKEDVARVLLPIPQAWLRAARLPRLRVAWAWDPPVNDAVPSVWASRRVVLKVRPALEADAYRGVGRTHASHPLQQRKFLLDAATLTARRVVVATDLWVLEVSYEEIAEYCSTSTFTSEQRVAFTAEIWDEDVPSVSPQPAVAALAVTATMNRLASAPVQLAAPITVRVQL